MSKHLTTSIFALISLLFCKTNFAQTISYLDSSQKGVSFRGLSVVTNNVFWVSGSKGTVGKTTDGGQHFTWLKPKGFEKTDFRDIEAFDENTAIIMGIDSPGIILKTKDGGANWKIVYRNDTHGIFLDAMAFKNNLLGVCLGDPIDDRFWLVETNDGGDSWTDVPFSNRPIAEKGEACFASSGTNIQFLNDRSFEYGFVSGGMDARFFKIGGNKSKLTDTNDLPIMKGQVTTGANSLIVDEGLIVVGGDFKNYKRGDSTTTFYDNVNKIWKTPKQGPSGYKSCVISVNAGVMVATGLSGTDVSSEVLNVWENYSQEPFHVVQKAKDGNAIYLAGGNGRIAKLFLIIF